MLRVCPMTDIGAAAALALGGLLPALAAAHVPARTERLVAAAAPRACSPGRLSTTLA